MKKQSFLRNMDTASTTNYVLNGELHENSQISTVMIESDADLANIEGLSPGSIAYIKGFVHMWQLGADGQWAVVV